MAKPKKVSAAKKRLMSKKKPKKPAVKVPSAPSYEDATYQRQLGYYKKLEADYGAEETRKRGDISTYYGTEGVLGKKTKEAVKKTVKFKKATPVTKAQAAKLASYKRRIQKHRKKGHKDVVTDLKGERSYYKKKAHVGEAGYNPFTKEEKAKYANYKKYATPKKAAEYLKSATGTRFGTRKEDVYDIKTHSKKIEIKKDILKRDKLSAKQRAKYKKIAATRPSKAAEFKEYAKTHHKLNAAERRAYKLLVAKGNPKKAGKAARSFRELAGRNKVAYRVPTGKFKTKKWTTRSQRFRTYMKGAKPATEGLYQRELRESRTKDLKDIRDDYAARGILRSGLYAKRTADYEKEFGKQLGEMNRKRKSSYQELGQQRATFLREQSIQKEQARLEAIRRRAARTGAFL